MSANSLVLQLCKPGDHVLCVDDIYGETKEYLKKILGPNSHVEMTFDDFDLKNIEKFKK